MRSKKKLSKTQRMIRKVGLSIVSVLLAVVVYFETTVRDRLELSIIAQIKTVSNKAINDAINEYIKNNKEICDSIVNVISDDASNVKSISEDMYYTNIVKTDIIDVSQSAVDSVMKTHGIDVQLGNFTGLTILSEFGPYIPVDIDATTTISCDIISSFESCGVNQSLHRTQLEMYVDIYVGNPFRIESVNYNTSYELSQTLIVGSAPSAYGNISRY